MKPNKSQKLADLRARLAILEQKSKIVAELAKGEELSALLLLSALTTYFAYETGRTLGQIAELERPNPQEN